MASVFNEDYYEAGEEERDPPEAVEVANDEVTNDIDLQRIEQTVEDPELTNDWWLCDGCHEGIPPGDFRFDCTECENFCLCANCRYSNPHEHKLSKKRV
jgi:hypothetical protein